MDSNDLAAADCLETLLEEQAVRLRALAQRMAVCLGRARVDGVAPSDWAGPARNARDELTVRIRRELALALDALEQAAVQSRHGASTLAGRG